MRVPNTWTAEEAKLLHYVHCDGCEECRHEPNPGGYFNPEAPDDCLTCGRVHD